jgi:hypothetical protein
VEQTINVLATVIGKVLVATKEFVLSHTLGLDLNPVSIHILNALDVEYATVLLDYVLVILVSKAKDVLV